MSAILTVFNLSELGAATTFDRFLIRGGLSRSPPLIALIARNALSESFSYSYLAKPSALSCSLWGCPIETLPIKQALASSLLSPGHEPPSTSISPPPFLIFLPTHFEKLALMLTTFFSRISALTLTFLCSDAIEARAPH